jgi:hypothetical protein
VGPPELLRQRTKTTRGSLGLRPRGKEMRRILHWIAAQIGEKVNIPAVWRELKEAGRTHGRRFLIAAVVWELIEDVLFPLLAWWAGAPELIPVFLVLHFEPVAYPVIFWMFREYDKKMGRAPANPARSTYSAHWRSWAKAAQYNIATFGALSWALLKFSSCTNSTLPVTYGVLMLLLNYVHERVWHDSNYGITDTDTVEVRRVLAKTLTYRVVAVMVMYPLMKVHMGYANWWFLAAWHFAASTLYMTMEAVWSKSTWGLAPNGTGVRE